MTGTTRTGAAELLQYAPRRRQPVVDAIIRILRSPVGGVSAAVIVLLVVVAVLAPYISPHSFRALSTDSLHGPSPDHWLGTDNIGRDTFARMLQGTRVSLYAGFLTVTAGTIVGSIVGLVSGYVGGYTDLILQRVVDAIQAFPALLLTMALISVLGASTTNGVLAIAVFIAASNSRVVRGAVLSVRQEVYIEAATAVGASPIRVMFRHVLPNVVAPILILISAAFGAAILIEGALSFLGLATQPPNVSWGTILREGRKIMEQSPWMAISAGSAISITVLAFNMLGDAVRDALDPRLRGSR